jgi:hypothetical protein
VHQSFGALRPIQPGGRAGNPDERPEQIECIEVRPDVAAPFWILTGPIPLHEGVCRESVPEMPHAAFSTECRGQENAA